MGTIDWKDLNNPDSNMAKEMRLIWLCGEVGKTAEWNAAASARFQQVIARHMPNTPLHELTLGDITAAQQLLAYEDRQREAVANGA